MKQGTIVELRNSEGQTIYIGRDEFGGDILLENESVQKAVQRMWEMGYQVTVVSSLETKDKTILQLVETIQKLTEENKRLNELIAKFRAERLQTYKNQQIILEKLDQLARQMGVKL